MPQKKTIAKETKTQQKHDDLAITAGLSRVHKVIKLQFHIFRQHQVFNPKSFSIKPVSKRTFESCLRKKK
jgi:hypothetical protein